MTTTAQFTHSRTPVKPFYFNTSAHLLRISTQKANTLMTTNVRRWPLLLRLLLRDRAI